MAGTSGCTSCPSPVPLMFLAVYVLGTKSERVLNFFFNLDTVLQSFLHIWNKSAKTVYCLILFFNSLCWWCCRFFFIWSAPPTGLMDVVKPVNYVEEGKHGGEDHSRPLVDGVDVRQVRYVHLELRSPSPEPAFLLGGVTLQGAVPIVLAGHGRPAVLEGWAVVSQHGAARVAQPPGQIGRPHFVLHLHRGQPDVVWCHLYWQ